MILSFRSELESIQLRRQAFLTLNGAGSNAGRFARRAGLFQSFCAQWRIVGSEVQRYDPNAKRRLAAPAPA
jgi:hypothetical protein